MTTAGRGGSIAFLRSTLPVRRMRRFADDVDPVAGRVGVLLQMTWHSFPPEFADLQRGEFVRGEHVGSRNDRGGFHVSRAGQAADPPLFRLFAPGHRAGFAPAEGIEPGGKGADQDRAADHSDRLPRRTGTQRAEPGGGIGTSGGKLMTGTFGELPGALRQGVLRGVLNEIAHILPEVGDVFANAGKQADGAAVLK